VPNRIPLRDAPCTPAQLGVATCPCSGTVDAAAYQRLVDTTVRGLTTHPDVLLTPLTDRMATLAVAERFEEAADMRDRAAALAGALTRQRRLDSLRRAGVVRVAFRRGGGAEVHNGVLVRTWSDVAIPELPFALGPEPPPADRPLPLALADEVGCIAGWLDAEAARVRLEHCDGGLASLVDPLPSFRPGPGVVSGTLRQR
jgi:DNA polymerase-3 subunit epsilon